jgi:hypothetical protein
LPRAAREVRSCSNGHHYRFSFKNKGSVSRIQQTIGSGREVCPDGRIDGYNGVEIVYPYEVNDPAATRQVLEKYGLDVAAVNVNVKAEPEFRNGGLTSHLPEVREKAVRFIKEAKDFR